jgi:hypothetical protein
MFPTAAPRWSGKISFAQRLRSRFCAAAAALQVHGFRKKTKNNAFGALKPEFF